MEVKRIINRSISLILMVAVMAIAVVSCGGNQAKIADTIRVEPDPTPELPVEDIMDAQLNSRGIGPVRRGMRIVDIKPRVENLYDTIVHESGYDSNSYTFYMNGNPRFTVYEFESGIANVIAAEDESIVVKSSDDRFIRLGDEFGKVMSLNGVKPVWQAADDEGMWCWTWQGLWFQPDQQNLNDNLAHKLYNQAAAPVASDFTKDITIGYIGTGLPW